MVLLACGCNDSSATVAAPSRSPTTAPPVVPRVDPLPTVRPATTRTVIPRFTDVAEPLGVSFSFYPDVVDDRYFLPEIMGGGAAWLDFDRDGVLDLFQVNGCRLVEAASGSPDFVSRLFLGRRGDGFLAVPDDRGAAVSRYGQGSAGGDFNADGFPDIFQSSYGPNVLLENNGDGTFTDITDLAGVGDDRWSTSVLWLDVDADGDLDLYVVNYLDTTLENSKLCEYAGVPGYCGPGQYNAVPDRVYLNQSDGTFREAAEELGLVADSGKGLVIIATDFDNDLVPEIYVGNDMTPNFLFVRQPGEAVRYREVATASGAAQSGDGMNEATMGIGCSDFDNDGLVDLYLTHYFHMKNTFYRNAGDLLFDDMSRVMGVAQASYDRLGFGIAPLDFDRDGFDDLFIATGHVLGPKVEPNEMNPQLIHNVGGRRFEDIAAEAGPYFQKQYLGRGVAAADFDDDGDRDVLVTHLDHPAALLRNDTEAGGHYLGIRFQTESRMAPVGARVTVKAGDRQSTRMVNAGGSYLSTGDERLLFSLGDDATTASVEILWPSGRVDRFDDLAVDEYWLVHEGRAPERPAR